MAKNPNLPADGKVSMEDRWAQADQEAGPGFDPATRAPNVVEDEDDDEIDLEAIEAELSDDGDADENEEA